MGTAGFILTHCLPSFSTKHKNPGVGNTLVVQRGKLRKSSDMISRLQNSIVSTNMFLRICCISIIVCLVLASAYAQNSGTTLQNPNDAILNANSLVINQSISTTIGITNSQYLNWVKANFSFLPATDFRQTPLVQNFNPQPSQREENYVIFQFNKPGMVEEYSVNNIVKTQSVYKPVTGKVTFPLDQIPPEARGYLGQTELIDINADIQRKAEELAGDSDDLFEVAFNIADWITKNVEYDLNTITVDATQKASWVLETKSGVCDELSTLYMAMLRAINIPVRFASGVSYSNSPLFSEPWQGHAWTEVYFPDYGWVPFDLTYKQFGYIDATHIKLKTSNDADETTTLYFWEGRNLNSVKVNLNELKFSQQILSSEGEIEQTQKINPALLHDNLGEGSWGLLEIELVNQESYYVTNTIYLQSANELSFEQNDIPVLLRPLETTYIYVPFQITNALETNVRYTIPLAISDLRGFYESHYVIAQKTGPSYTRSQITQEQQIAQQLHNEDQLLDTSVGCRPEKLPVFVNEETTILCEISSKKNSDFELCLYDKCYDTRANEQLSFTKVYPNVGESRTTLSVTANGKSKNALFALPVQDYANITLENIVVPSQVEYGQKFKISFTIQKNSFADPQNMRVGVKSDVPSSWNLGTITADKDFEVTMFSSQLYPGENKLEITAEYFDGGAVQTIKYPVTVELTNVPFFTKIWLYVLYIFR